jgi:hypothetical protein
VIGYCSAGDRCQGLREPAAYADDADAARRVVLERGFRFPTSRQTRAVVALRSGKDRMPNQPPTSSSLGNLWGSSLC